MRRIFVNVIKNAFDAMPNGGDLTVTSEVNGEKVVFCFEDTGCGMTPDVLAKIWMPRFTTKAKGMGLVWRFAAELLKVMMEKFQLKANLT